MTSYLMGKVLRAFFMMSTFSNMSKELLEKYFILSLVKTTE